MFSWSVQPGSGLGQGKKNKHSFVSMNISLPLILVAGIIIFLGLVFGELAVRLRLPKITGYIFAGVLLNPGFTDIVPQSFVRHAEIITDVALSFITFSIGGTLFYPRVKSLGRSILSITLFEAECAFFVVIAGMAAVAPFFLPSAPGHGSFWVYLPFALLMGALASPTDPSATLAVTHEYKASGEVTSTIMGVAALDDVTGIINYSIALVVAQAMVLHEHVSALATFFGPVGVVFGAVGLGILFGVIFLFVMRLVYREGEGFMIVAVFALTTLCYGTARFLHVEELLSTMTMGMVVVNFSPVKEEIFSVLERYTEELVFVIFFTLSGMYLNFSVLGTSLVLVLFFIIFRFAGKTMGVYVGARLARSPDKVRKYTAGGLIPQGGIVIGLALLVKANAAFSHISDMIVSIIIGACVIHELAGPILARFSLSRAQELHKDA